MKHFVPSLLTLCTCMAFWPAGAQAATITNGASTSAGIAATTSSRPVREVFGFALASSLSDPTVGYPSWNFNLLSTIAFFGLHVNDDGSFAADSDAGVWDSSALTNLVSTAHSHGAKVVLTIIEQDFSSGTPHMCSALKNGAKTVTNTVAEVKAKGVDGVNVDYEGLNGSCGTTDPSWARHHFPNFVATLRGELPAGSYLSVDTYASSAADSLNFFDVKTMSAAVDSFFVMAYDLEYSNWARAPLGCSRFCLGPTAPLTGYYYNDTTTSSQYMSAVPASKVILGVPYYGRKACVGSATPNQYPTSTVVADTYLDASGEAGSGLVQPGTYAVHRDGHDPAGQERWDTWVNSSLGCTRELYWDDTVSLGHKYDLINKDNLRGVGIWNLNYGGGAPELWSTLALHFAKIPGTPGSLAACAGSSSASVSWTPARSLDGPVISYVVTASPGGATVTVPGTASFATVGGLTPGTAYTFTVQATNSAGPGVGGTTASVTPVSALVSTGYFMWFDRASPGMAADNIHLFNAGATGSSGCVTLSGRVTVPFTLAAGQEQHLTLPAGTLGGPVVVTTNTGSAVLATQRVQYYQSFNEVWAMSPAQAATVSYLSWFDRATPGMVADNIHVLNPGSATATVTVSMPGATPIGFTLAAGAETHVTFPLGKIGGPVKISADQPVLATQRVQYYRSFNESIARASKAGAQVSYFQWFDRASPGMVGDNIHVLNPGTATAHVSVSLGASSIALTLAPGQEGHVAFAKGKIGGPVKVSADVNVLAWQRVQYYQSFNEVVSATQAQALATSYVMWFDRATPGMVGDNIHVLNAGTTAASVTISLPGATAIKFTLAAGAEAHVTFPAGKIGGPVTIASDQPVLAAQRVQYYQSFNEVEAN